MYMRVSRTLRLAGALVCLAGHVALAQKVYWVEDPDSSWPHHAAIRRADGDGTNSELVVSNRLRGANSIVVDSSAGVMYIAADGIYRWQADATHDELLIPNERGRLALDLVNRRLYWSTHSTIKRANLDGSHVEPIVADDICCIEGLAIDPAAGFLYWTDRGASDARDGQIVRASLDGQDAHVVLSGLTDPMTLVLDQNANKLYWWEDGGLQGQDPRPGILRADVDGSHVELVVPNESSESPTGTYPLALDEIHGKLYWSDGHLQRVNLDGTGAESSNFFPGITGLSVDPIGGALYWVTGGKVGRLDIDDLALSEVIYQNPIYSPWGLALDEQAGWLYWSEGASLIKRSRLDGRAVQTVVETGSFAQVIKLLALDSTTGTLYWTLPRAVQRALVPGGAIEDVLVSPPLRGPRGIAFNPADRWLYWADYFDDAIRRVNTEGGQVVELAANLGAPWGVALDPTRGKLYWTETQPGAIRKSNLDGSEIETLLEGESVGVPLGLVVNVQLGRIFWCEFYGGRIRSADFDGNDVATVLDEGVDCPAGLALNQMDGRAYWIDVCEQNDGSLRRARLDGTQSEIIIAGGMAWPREVAISPAGDQVYWTEAAYFNPDLAAVKRANLDGSGIQTVSAGVTSAPRGITLDGANSFLFWTEGDGRASIQRTRLDGSDPYEVVVVLTPHGIALDVDAHMMYITDSKRILRSDLDGSNVEAVVQTENSRSIALDPPAGNVYWTQNGMRSVHRANIDGSEDEILVTHEPPNSPNAITLDLRAGKLYWTTQPTSGPSAEPDRVWRSDLDGTNAEVIYDHQREHASLSGGMVANPTPHISYSVPRPCAIDARQPHDPHEPSTVYGWSYVDLEFTAAPSYVALENFEILELGGDGIPPDISDIASIDPTSVRVTLATPIEPGAWTCFHHLSSGTNTCLGYLPGDVNGDGASTPSDILRLIDSLNGIVDPPYELWRTDIDRSGVAAPADALRLIDLLNGAGVFQSWLAFRLSTCPS